MKKTLLVPGVCLGIAVFAQKPDAPAAAKAAFAKAFPGMSKAVWEKEDGNYEVSFENDGKKMSLLYDAKGVLKESEVSIQVSGLPAAAITYMNQHYKGINIKGAAKITKPDGSIQYKAELKGKDILFDSPGKFIKEAKN